MSDDNKSLNKVIPVSENRTGFYAIQLVRAEIYDLGNISNIPHFIIYDRSTGIAIDVTSDVKPAPLLSETAPAKVLSDTLVETIEKYLTGKAKPVENWEEAGYIPCITGFYAEELTNDKYSPIRKAMLELKQAKQTLDEKIEALRGEAMVLKQKYINPSK